jgi:hypothetical protein
LAALRAPFWRRRFIKAAKDLMLRGLKTVAVVHEHLSHIDCVIVELGIAELAIDADAPAFVYQRIEIILAEDA